MLMYKTKYAPKRSNISSLKKSTSKPKDATANKFHSSATGYSIWRYCALVLILTTILFFFLWNAQENVESETQFQKARTWIKKIQQTTTIQKNANVAGELPKNPFPMNTYDTIFFYRTRKADGGSSLRLFLKNVSEKHNLTFIAKEGYIQYFNNHTLYITSLGDPIDRVLSSYWLEGRWPYHHHNDKKKNRYSNDTTAAVEFMDWARRYQYNNDSVPAFVWFCVSECFCKWFGGLQDRLHDTVNVTNAYQRLQKFDLILQTERLVGNELLYLETIQTLLNATDIPFQRRNEDTIWQANNASSFLTQEEMNYLYRVNKNDLELLRMVFGDA